jgi:hypothetical protein
MNERVRLACPECGTPMNRHAEKLDQSRLAGDPGWDGDLDGVLVEFHTCPVCRFVVERPAV